LGSLAYIGKATHLAFIQFESFRIGLRTDESTPRLKMPLRLIVAIVIARAASQAEPKISMVLMPSVAGRGVQL